MTGAVAAHEVLREHIGDGVILHGYRGSIAHGMYVPDSDPDSIDDVDTMAFVVPGVGAYYGLEEFGSRGTVEIKDGPWDIVAYEVRKVMRLLAQGNPNVLSMLWLPERHLISFTPAGRLLLANRGLFAGAHVYRPFAGYAVSQLEKMERGAFKGYMGDRRKRLVERNGYDTKNAAHLIRLLRMCVEFLGDGEMRVDRTGIDAEQLLEIKRGEWSLGRVKGEAALLFDQASVAYERCSLPEKPSGRAVNALCIDVVRMALA